MIAIRTRLRGRARGLLVGAGVLLALGIITQFLLPGRGSTGHGTPAAIVFFGFVEGMLHALSAAGIILVFRATRVINFAQVAFGIAGAVVALNFILFTEVPFLVAFALGLLIAAATGLLFDLIFGRRFFNAPRLVLTVLTIIAAPFLSGWVAERLDGLPFFPPIEARPPILPDLRQLLPFSDLRFQVGDLPLFFGFVEIFALEVAALSLIGLAIFFRRTRAGVAVRAMAENTERARLLGISVGALSSLVWTLAGLLSGVGVMATSFVRQQSGEALAEQSLVLLLPAFAAAVLARMRSIGVALIAAVAITIGTRAFEWSFADDTALIQLGLFLVVAVGLLVQRRELARSEAGAAESWQATEEQRPVPKELLAVGGLRVARWVLIGLALVGAGLYPFVTATGMTNLGGVIAIGAIAAVSLVVLTGWAGQVSLGQFAFVAIGAVVASSLTARLGVTFWLAVPTATVLSGLFAFVVGIPALRLRGLFLAVTTFALSIAVAVVLFQDRYFGWLLPEAGIERPRLFFLDFEDERSMYFLSVAALALVLVAVVNLRRSRFGRVLIAQRENAANLQSFGVGVVRLKLLAFAVSGAIAGFAGAIFAFHQRGVSAESFGATASIDLFTGAVIGGLGSVVGPLIGWAYIRVTDFFITDDLLLQLFTGGGTLLLLYAAPGGLISIFTRIRDGVLRIVAQRRQIVVPSLFADYDPEALERRLIPLAAQAPSDGLAALPLDLRFRGVSQLHGLANGERRGPDERADETEAIRAAAASAAGEEDAG